MFMLPTVVLEHGWMEVKLKLEREEEEYEAEKLMLCKFSSAEVEEVFIFCPLSGMS